MSEDVLEQEAQRHEEDFFDEVQEKRDNPSLERPPKEPAKKTQDPEEPSEEEQEEPEEEKEKEPDPEKEKPEKLSKKYEELKKKHEKIEKNLLETQKYATKKAQQTKQQARNFEKKIQDLYEKGALSEGEAQELLLKPDEEDVSFEVDEDVPELVQYFKAATVEFENLKRYSDDESLEEKKDAFNFLIANSTAEELEEIESKLKPFKNDPVALAKTMLSIGDEENKYFFKEIKALGGIRGYIKYKNEQFESKDNKIAKLEKKLLQYEDFDKRPNYRLSDHSSHNKEERVDYDDPFDEVKAKDSRPVKRR